MTGQLTETAAALQVAELLKALRKVLRSSKHVASAAKQLFHKAQIGSCSWHVCTIHINRATDTVRKQLNGHVLMSAGISLPSHIHS